MSRFRVLTSIFLTLLVIALLAGAGVGGYRFGWFQGFQAGAASIAAQPGGSEGAAPAVPPAYAYPYMMPYRFYGPGPFFGPVGFFNPFGCFIGIGMIFLVFFLVRLLFFRRWGWGYGMGRPWGPGPWMHGEHNPESMRKEWREFHEWRDRQAKEDRPQEM